MSFLSISTKIPAPDFLSSSSSSSSSQEGVGWLIALWTVVFWFGDTTTMYNYIQILIGFKRWLGSVEPIQLAGADRVRPCSVLAALGLPISWPYVLCAFWIPVVQLSFSHLKSVCSENRFSSNFSGSDNSCQVPPPPHPHSGATVAACYQGHGSDNRREIEMFWQCRYSVEESRSDWGL